MTSRSQKSGGSWLDWSPRTTARSKAIAAENASHGDAMDRAGISAQASDDRIARERREADAEIAGRVNRSMSRPAKKKTKKKRTQRRDSPKMERALEKAGVPNVYKD